MNAPQDEATPATEPETIEIQIELTDESGNAIPTTDTPKAEAKPEGNHTGEKAPGKNIGKFKHGGERQPALALRSPDPNHRNTCLD